MQTVPWYSRAITDDEVQKMRLLLSTFCDGSGATNAKVSWTVPDYRDFERVVAESYGGFTPENKGIFDVHVPTPASKIGISCKMAGPGSPRDSHAAFIELSNSSKKFLDEFNSKGIVWHEEPDRAGPAVVKLVESWHAAVSTEFDLSNSSFLLLTHSNDWRTYKLASFPLDLSLADPFTDIEWLVQNKRTDGRPNSLHGYYRDANGLHRTWEFYPNSGGQLKYRPLWAWANWQSAWFELEIPPLRNLTDQAKLYFGDQWPTDA